MDGTITVTCPECGWTATSEFRSGTINPMALDHNPGCCNAGNLWAAKTEEQAPDVPASTWSGLFGIDPDYTEGVPADEWLDQNRGYA
jgi:hypothetical protein